MTKKINNKNVLLAAIIGGTLLQSANTMAELYISPVVRDTVQYYNYDQRDSYNNGSGSGVYYQPSNGQSNSHSGMHQLYGDPNHGVEHGSTVHNNGNNPQQNMRQGYTSHNPNILNKQPNSGLNNHNHYGENNVVRNNGLNKNHPNAQEMINGYMNNQMNNSMMSGNSSIHGDFVMRHNGSDFIRFGNNVPLFVALENIIPNSKNWKISIDDGLENIPVSWEGGDSWEGSLKAMEDANDLSVAINHEEMAIGVSRTSDVSIALASRQQMLWRLDSKLSLRGNIEKWVEEANWNIHWDEAISKVDFPIVASAAFKGKLDGTNGVIDKLLQTTESVPLVADFYYANKVVHIRKAGYEQEVSF